ncbi:MAG TPA: Gfo/Idh/MocA family oxidoreductase [Armatimonadota bacterium]|jgi:predicted dehydrogenase
MSDPVRWGVLGTARFALNRWLPSFTQTPGVEGVAIASRDLDRARSAAAKFGFETAYGSYEALLADPAVEAVYIPLPNGLHAVWALEAIAAGKHVLVEKPAWPSAEDGRRVADAVASRGVRVMEAFMIRHHARWKRIVELIAEGAIGAVTHLSGSFCFTLDDAANFRWDPALAGGALADVGCYPVNAARLVFGSEPVRVEGVSTDSHGVGVDSSFEGTLHFEKGTATFRCSFEAAYEQSLTVKGEAGEISLNLPFICRDEPVLITVHAAGKPGREERIPLGDQYVDEIAHFNACVRDASRPLWPGEDGVSSAAVLDALRASAKAGGPVKV